MRSQSGDEKPWRAVGRVVLDTPVKSDDAMTALISLVPMHFANGKAEEYDGIGRFKNLIQALMPQTSASDGRAT